MKSLNGTYAAELIRDIAKIYYVKVRAESEDLGVKNVYRILLAQLYVEDGGTQLFLAEKTGMKAPTVSITLRKMEKEGLVKREIDESDLRKTHVFLTEKGKQTIEGLNDKINGIGESMLCGMSAEEKKAFIKALEGAKAALK